MTFAEIESTWEIKRTCPFFASVALNHCKTGGKKIQNDSNKGWEIAWSSCKTLPRTYHHSPWPFQFKSNRTGMASILKPRCLPPKKKNNILNPVILCTGRALSSQNIFHHLKASPIWSNPQPHWALIRAHLCLHHLKQTAIKCGTNVEIPWNSRKLSPFWQFVSCLKVWLQNPRNSFHIEVKMRSCMDSAL